MRRLVTTSFLFGGGLALLLVLVPMAGAQDKDAKPAEIESKDLRFEKVVAPGKTISIRVRALKPGTYVFLDDYNKSTRGKIVAE